jgi:hypothetical protein
VASDIKGYNVLYFINPVEKSIEPNLESPKKQLIIIAFAVVNEDILTIYVENREALLFLNS